MNLTTDIRILASDELGTIANFERIAWPEHLAASRSILETRFRNGHTMLGAWQNGQLIGMASWRLGWLDKKQRESFPNDFADFSGASNSELFNAAFVYNLGIHPDHRGKAATTQLVYAVLDHARLQGCTYIVGDGRCPSYLGSPQEKILPRPIFKEAIDAIISGQKNANLNDYLTDPILNFYYRLLKCEFLWIIPDFIPDDAASGGYRVIFCKALS